MSDANKAPDGHLPYLSAWAEYERIHQIASVIGVPTAPHPADDAKVGAIHALATEIALVFEEDADE